MLEKDFATHRGAPSACRYAICDADACAALHARLAPIEARLRAQPRSEALPSGAPAEQQGVSQLRQVYHFDPMQLLAVLERVSLHRDYLLEFLLYRPHPMAPAEARVYVRKRFVPAFFRDAAHFDMICGDSRCVLHHLDYERSAEGVLEFFLLWFLLGNLFRPVDRQAGGELVLFTDAQKEQLVREHADALDASGPALLAQFDLRPRVAFTDSAATLHLHSFDWHHGLREREFRIRYPCEVMPLGAETLIAPGAPR